jgi:dihydrofolate reductase
LTGSCRPREAARRTGARDSSTAGWQLDNGYFDDVEGQVVTEAFESSDGMLLGRRTYDIFAGYWPTSTEEPIVGQMNAMKKYVASTTLKEPLEWENSMLLHGDVVEAARKLQEEPGRDLQVIGSGISRRP